MVDNYQPLTALQALQLSKNGVDDITSIMAKIESAAKKGNTEVVVINNIDGANVPAGAERQLRKLGYNVTTRYAQPYINNGSDKQENMLTIRWSSSQTETV